MPGKELFEFGSFRLDPAEQRLLRDGEPVPLEPKVFETLLMLVRHRGTLVPKDDLMQAVWPESFVEESNLTRNISVLRKALSRTDGGPQYIETVPKRGYRFVGDIRPLTDAPAEVLVQSTKVTVLVEGEENDDATGDETGHAFEPARRTTRGRVGRALDAITRHKVAAALALVVAVVAVAVAYRTRFVDTALAVDSFAVLPFVNAGSDPANEYIADGITDGVIDRLSLVPELRVMSHNSVFHYKGRDVDAQAAGKELGVRAVLTGRISIVGDRLSVVAELVDVRDNSHIWGGQYQRSLSDTLAVQTELARDISEKLQLRLSGAERQQLMKRSTESAEANDLYMKGRYYGNNGTNTGTKASFEYYQRAIGIDPGFAAAYAGLAQAYTVIGMAATVPDIPPSEAFPKAKAAATRALELDETLASAHTSLGRIAMVFELDWHGAETEFARALALNPNDVDAHHWYSHYLISTGRFDESLAKSERALALDPLDVEMNAHLGFHFIRARQYDRAIAQLQKTLELNPSIDATHGLLGLAYEESGQFDEAVAEYRRSVDLGGPDVRGSLGHVYAVSGRRAEAQKLLDELLDESAQKYVSPYGIAKIYAGLGETDEALTWLEKAYAQRDSNIVDLKVDPDFDAIHADPRFGELLGRVGLQG